MLVADLVCIPLQPSQFDMWTIPPMASMVNKAKSLNHSLEARIVFNRASPNPAVQEIEEAREILSDLEEIEISEAVIKERISFRKAIRDGLSVVEMTPADPKAVTEMSNLYEECFNDKREK